MSYWDTFFHYGTGNLHEESVYDLYEILLQPKRSFYYYRKGSAGIIEYENNPNGLSLQILARFEIASTIAYRNTLVSNGEDSSIDRRIIVSQHSISFQTKDSNLDIGVNYFLYSDYQTPKTANFLLSV